MKALATLRIILFATSVVFTACKEEDTTPVYTVSNQTGFAVNLKGRTNGMSVDIANGETKKIKSSSIIQLFDVTSTQTQKRFDYIETSENTYRLRAYDFDVLYKVTGQNVGSATITWATPSGGTGQSTQSLPANIGFRVYDRSFKYVSAQASTGGGCVTVTIYKKDEAGRTETKCGFTVASVSE